MLLSIIVTLIIVGVILYLINTYLTIMDAKIKTILNWTVVILTIVWVVKTSGLLAGLNLPF